MIKVYKENNEELNIGDRVKIVTARTSGSRTYNVIIKKIVDKKNKHVKGEVLNGPEAGMTQVGFVLGEVDD